MKQHYCNGVSLFALLMVLLMSTSSAQADYVYAFSALSAADDFSFTSPTLITTTGAFTTSFTIGGLTYPSGFFSATNDCFSFSTTTAVSCDTSNSGNSFFAFFPGAITEGTFPVSEARGCSAPVGDCVILSSVTITNATTTPEPSGFVLFGTGLLGVAGVLRRRWKS